MKISAICLLVIPIVLVAATPAAADINLDGFLQGLYGGRLDETNPTPTEQTASETRMQLRAQHLGDNAEFFGRLDFVFDGTDSSRYDWELREAYVKFRVGSRLDFKVGRQVLTWGTGDLVFINDVFAKDYRSFFVGRDDQYLKAPQNAVRAAHYNALGEFSLVWSPRFEANRLPDGSRLSFFNPMADSGRGAIVGAGNPANRPVVRPEPKYENGEFAARWQRQVGYFALAAYLYKGFYKNPMGMEADAMVPIHPRLNVYGLSAHGMMMGGVLWLEAGYFDSRQDQDGDNPYLPNSSFNGLVGFERQVASNFTANLQWQADYMMDHDTYQEQQQHAQLYYRDEVRHLLTTRWTKLLNNELVTLSAFAFYSPSDHDAYVRLSASYKYTDELTLTAGGNIFEGKHEASEFGQFRKNDNAYVKVTYGF